AEGDFFRRRFGRRLQLPRKLSRLLQDFFMAKPLLPAGIMLLATFALALAEPPRLQVESKSPAACVAWSPDGKRLAVGTKDGAVRVLDAATGKELNNFQA